MKSKSKTYKRLGDYIEQVNVRNTDLKVDYLVGLTINKKFIPSVANTIGTNMANYKIIERNQFACSLMQVSRDGKIPIARFEEEVGIMSPAYPVFKVVDETALLPAYLMMWFEREEFDREAAYYAVGGVRGNLTWDDFCDMKLPVPSIEKQQQIVDEYQSIENKIKVNEQICEKLEDTAQAIYREWFVEGADIDDLPEGWKVEKFTDFVKLSGGGTPNTQNDFYWDGHIPFFTPADIEKGYYTIRTSKYITKKGLKNSSTKVYSKNTIFVTARGTVGAVALPGCEMAMNQSCYALTGKLPYFTHQLVLTTVDKLKSEAVGAVFAALVTRDFDLQYVIVPPLSIQRKYDDLVSNIYRTLLLKSFENQKLLEFKTLLLTRMVKQSNSN